MQRDISKSISIKEPVERKEIVCQYADAKYMTNVQKLTRQFLVMLNTRKENVTIVTTRMKVWEIPDKKRYCHFPTIVNGMENNLKRSIATSLHYGLSKMRTKDDDN